MPETKEDEIEVPVTILNVDKSIRSKSKSSSIERNLSPTTKFTIRQSVESPSKQISYEIVGQSANIQLEESMSKKQTPSVKLTRISSPSKLQSNISSIENGLDPIGIELISGSITSGNFESKIQIKAATPPLNIAPSIITPPPLAPLSTTPDEIIIPKMTREMRNLQKSTNDSKVLTDFLNTIDSPRIRARKPKESPSPSTTTTSASSTTTAGVSTTSNVPTSSESEKIQEPLNESVLSASNLAELDKEMPLKKSPASNDGMDSDSTVVFREENVKKRRKSVLRSRSRARSVSGRSRQKSISRILSDELAATSDKEDLNDDIEEIENASELSYSSVKHFENRAPNPPPKPGWDSFCFKCHTDNAVLSLACSKCKCSYHRHCVRPNPIPKNVEEFVCPECREIENAEKSPVNKYNHPKIDMHMLKEMLTTILEKIRTYPEREVFENDIPFKPLKESEKERQQLLIVRPMSLKTIEERITNNYYKVTEAFFHDIRQLEHNWTIVDKSKTKTLKLIIKYVHTETNEMEACVHCFASSFVVSNWFTAPCKRPHLLIWAKLKGYPYWPAKVMSVSLKSDSRYYADVRFFGAHDRAWVPTAHCLVFSEKDPNKSGKASTPNKSTGKTQKGIADAMKEKDEYIENMQAQYGFRYSPFREVLDPENLQTQLEYQLPGLKKDSRDHMSEKELEGLHKEKLTLKIIKSPDGTQTIEQRTPKINEKDRHPLYRVLSKAEENFENNQSKVVKAIILKRNINSNNTKEKSKRSRIDDTASETSESNLSISDSRAGPIRRKSIREPQKRRKSVKNVESRSSTPESIRKKRPNETSELEELLEEVPPPKPFKRSRNKSTLREANSTLVTQNSHHRVPPGTSEIHNLKDDESKKPLPAGRTKQRSRSFHRSSDTQKKEGMQRRLSANVSSNSNRIEERRRRSLSQGNSSTSNHMETGPRISSAGSSQSIIIKDEPQSEDEEIVQRERVTVNDLADLCTETTGKRKTILISTSDNSNDSFQNQNAKARKSFPTSTVSERQVELFHNQRARNLNAMVCIPQVFAPSENAHTSQDSIDLSRQNSVNGPSSSDQLASANGNTQSLENRRVSILRSSLHESPGYGSRLAYQSQMEPPRLVPKPTGVFTSEGNTFQRESGAISSLFSENAHRMTDYFKSLLIDTIGAISSGVPIAENVLLKLEIEKLKHNIASLKSENQMKLDKLRKEHQDELKVIRFSYDEKLKSMQNNFNEEKVHLITDIRKQAEVEKQRAIEATRRETKRMTWCSNCTKEARFYCCWNTSYCGPACQKTHWQTHQRFCTNRNSSNDSNTQQTNKQTTVVVAENTPAPSQNIPVTISVPSIANRNQTTHIVRISSAPTQQAISIPSTQAISTATITQLAPKSHLENAIRGHPQNQTVITGGQKIVQSIFPSQSFAVYQHKVPNVQHPYKQIVSAANATPSLITDQIPANLIVKTLPQGPNSPQINFISTSSANVSEIINSISPVNSVAAATSVALATTASPIVSTLSAPPVERTVITTALSSSNMQQSPQNNVSK